MRHILLHSIWLRCVMRITLSQMMIMLALTGIIQAETINAQNPLERDITLTIENTTLLQALEQIEKSTSVRFVYSKNFVSLKEKVSFSANQEKLGSVLTKVLYPLGIQ